MAKRNTQTTTQTAPAAAQAAPAATATTPSAAPVNAALAVVYGNGKPYNVRAGTAQANDRSWQALQATLIANGGQATMAQLQDAVKPFNHVPFVQYCVRRGWLATATGPQAASTQAA